MSKEQARFWFVWVKFKDGKDCALAVAAFTERSARIQARKNVGADATIQSVDPVFYAHAWRMDFSLNRQG